LLVVPDRTSLARDMLHLLADCSWAIRSRCRQAAIHDTGPAASSTYASSASTSLVHRRSSLGNDCYIMHLLQRLPDNKGFSLVERVGGNIPPYAILPHTWGLKDDEVTYKDVTKGRRDGKSGCYKLDFSSKQAAKDGLDFCWVDTCCMRNVAQETMPCENGACSRQKRWALKPQSNEDVTLPLTWLIREPRTLNPTKNERNQTSGSLCYIVVNT
jgi:hypothetical protein